MQNFIGGHKKWMLLLAMSLARAMVFLDQSAVPIALPQIQRSLNAPSVSLQWIINAYLLTIAAFIIVAGKISDQIGHRRTFLLGMLIFILSSVACVFASDATGLIIARAVQGIGGAFMIPSTSVIVINAFPMNVRGRVIGLFIGFAAIFLLLGPVLGGALTQWLSWRWIFLLNVPLAIISIGLTLYYIENHIIKQETNKIDWFGFVFSTLAIASLIFALLQSADLGWLSPWVLGSLALFVVSSIIFLWSQFKVKFPLLKLSLFTIKAFRAGSFTIFLIQTGLIMTIFGTIFNQDVLGYSPGIAGLLSLPAAIPILFMPSVSGRLLDKYGPRFPVTLGLIGVLMSFCWSGFLVYLHSYWWLLPGFILFGVSLPVCIGGCMTSALMQAPKNQRGLASGMTNALRQLGGALGLALGGAIINNMQYWRVKQGLHKVAALAQLKPAQLNGLLAGNRHALNTVSHFTQSQQHYLFHISINAYTTAFSSAMFACALLIVIALRISRGLPNVPIR